MKYRSVFDIIGPVMVGPSSSHTAGLLESVSWQESYSVGHHVLPTSPFMDRLPIRIGSRDGRRDRRWGDGV